MIQLTVTPRSRDNLYRLMIDKELELRRRRRGTLHRSGPKKAGRERWTHSTRPGRIDLKRGDDGVLSAAVRSRPDTEWRLLTSLIGFLDRHFRERISTVTIKYDH